MLWFNKTAKKPSRIGIPQALMFYRYFPLWKAPFELTGIPYVLSARPSIGFLKESNLPGAADLCLPVKLFLGHITNLKDRCDCIFVPRLVSLDKKTYNCPHFLGLPDVVRAQLDNSIPILDPTIDVRNRKRSLERYFKEISRFLPSNRTSSSTIREIALQQQTKALTKFPKRMIPKPFDQIPRKEAHYIIGLVGRPYILYEPELGGKLFQFFQQEKIFLITPEMISSSLKQKELRDLIRPIYWYNGRENVGSAFALFHNAKVDGIIQVVTFGCGPDSLMKEIIDFKASQEHVPYLSLVLDQHSTSTGIQTRLEAFIDMLKRRKRTKAVRNVTYSGPG